jgi:hypothetical protein
LCVWSVTDRDENNVSLVTLNRFKVLDEQALTFRRKRLGGRQSTASLQGIFDRVALCNREAGES